MVDPDPVLNLSTVSWLFAMHKVLQTVLVRRVCKQTCDPFPDLHNDLPLIRYASLCSGEPLTIARQIFRVQPLLNLFSVLVTNKMKYLKRVT